MSRIHDLQKDELDDDQRQVWNAIADGPRGYVRGPLQAWLHAPVLAQRAQSLGEYCRYGSSLDARLSELAILVTATVWRAAYEWNAHAPMALKAGVDAAVVDALARGETPRFSRADEQATYDFSLELNTTKRLSPATWSRCSEVLGTRGVVDLIGVLGYYTLISMTITALEISLPGAADPFEQAGAGR